MTKANQSIRDYAKANRIPLWRIADVIGVHESTFLRSLRKELSSERKKEIMNIIDGLRERD